MKDAIYHFKSAIYIGEKGNLTFYKTEKFEVSRGWSGDVYLEHNGNIIAKFYIECGMPLVRLRAGTVYEQKVCRALLRSIGVSAKYNGGDCLVNITQQYKAIKDGDI